MLNLIWAAVVVLFVLWLLGFSIHIGGRLIHLLLVLALIGIFYNLLIFFKFFFAISLLHFLIDYILYLKFLNLLKTSISFLIF